jgi:exopolysaccharide biosynthesis polyprenyl glycosylphosphotransferase
MTESPVLSELQEVLAKEAIDEVFVALPVERYSNIIDGVVQQCEEQGIMVRVRTPMFNLRIARTHIDDLDGVPVISIHSGPQEGWQLFIKRLIDVAGSALLITLLSPLLLLVALLVKTTSPGPVFFRQERIGLNKRRIQLLKFRTMVPDADKRQSELEHLNEAEGPVFKMKNDPRVTPVGRFMRRFSIDELPQLFNVLTGEMSLVGPRPLPVRDVERIDAQWHKRRFSVKPGLTCLWQVNGRSDVNFERWVRLDLEYIDRWSLGLDMKILAKTIPAVMKGSGAY